MTRESMSRVLRAALMMVLKQTTSGLLILSVRGVGGSRLGFGVGFRD